MRREKNDNKEDDLMPEKGSDLDLEREFEGSKSDRAMDRSIDRERDCRGGSEREKEKWEGGEGMELVRRGGEGCTRRVWEKCRSERKRWVCF